MKIIVGFSKAKSIFKIGSKIIAKSEARNYSHAFIRYICPITKIELVSQASHGYVNLVSYNIFLEDNIVSKEYKIECTNDQFLEVLKFIENNLGIPYSKLEILILFFKKLLHMDIYYNNHGTSYICSQWAASICSILGIKTPDNLSTFTPSDLDTLLSSANIEIN